MAHSDYFRQSSASNFAALARAQLPSVVDCVQNPDGSPKAVMNVLDDLDTAQVGQNDLLFVVESRFFGLGLQVGMGMQMFAVATFILFAADQEGGILCMLAWTYYAMFRGFFYLCLLFSCYGLNLYVWKRFGINYKGILAVSSGHSYHYIVRFSTLCMTVIFSCLVLYLFSLTSLLACNPNVWPALAVIFCVLVFIAPFNIFRDFNCASQRRQLLKRLLLVAASPFTATTFERSFVADILTSLPKMYLDVEYTACFYWIGGYTLASDNDIAFEPNSDIWAHKVRDCNDGNEWYKRIHTFLAVLPFWVRLMQCFRAYFDTKALPNLFNALKYFLSICVVLLSVQSDYHMEWLYVSVVSTLYSYAWDILMDWGLGPAALRRFIHGEASHCSEHSQHLWLRPTRLYPDIRFYYFAIVSDAFARFGWAIYISPGQKIVAQHFVLILGCLELLRRVTWALLRIEWEHIRRHVFGSAFQSTNPKHTPSTEALLKTRSRHTTQWN